MISPIVRAAAAAVLLAPTALAVAQDTTFRDLLQGARYPATLAPEELDGYHALRIGTTTAGSPLDLMMGIFPLFGMMGGAEGQHMMTTHAIVLSSWTKGDLVRVANQEYLVTYRAQPLNYEFETSNEMPPITLTLTLVRTDGIVTISPMPELTPGRFRELVRRAPGGQPPRGTKEAGLSNGKQIGLGALMYTVDYDDVYPYPQSTATMEFLIDPYIKNREIWRTHNPAGTRFLFNMALGGVNAAEPERPAEVPLFYESGTWPDGSRIVVFADGHVKAVDAREWARLEPELRRTYKRVARPLPADYGLDPRRGGR
jgi:prepilin-type processing-associated H-X9-DG protein